MRGGWDRIMVRADLMPFRMVCNDGQRESAKHNPDQFPVFSVMCGYTAFEGARWGR